MDSNDHLPGHPASTFYRSKLFQVLVFVAGTILIGAFLAPPLYWAGKGIVASGALKGGWLNGLHDSMERARFSRYFNRAILAGALLMLWPVLKWMGSSVRGGSEKGEKKDWLARLDLETNPVWWRHLLIGYAVAAIPLLILAWVYLSLDLYRWRPGWDHSLVTLLLSALSTGLTVALMEEFVFRGALFAVIGKVLGPWPLLLSVSAFFALVHFLHPPAGLEIPPVTASSGFWMLGQIFGQFGNPQFLVAEFAVLFAIGLVLGYVRMKTASLWMGIGLHGGWVFGVKVINPVTIRNFQPYEMMPWLGDNLRVGAVSCLVVCFTGLGLWMWLQKTEPRSPFSP